jgi:hypothetical protein
LIVRFKLTPFEKLRLGTEPAFLIKGLIPRVGLVVVWGPPKCGKSFWTFDLAIHVALGWEYRGRRVHRGAAVYCAFEGADGFKARAEAFRRRHLTADHGPIDFHLIAARANLVADHAELIRAIRVQLAHSPALVVLDTLNRSLQGSESKDEDMAAYVKAADAIRDAFHCAVIIVHHCGVEGTRPRGHTSLTGAADAQLAVKRDATGDVLVTVEWMKDGPEGDAIASRLEAIEVGIDSDGEQITSCVVVPVEGDVGRPAPARKLSDRQRLALDALTDCAADHGKPPPDAFRLPTGLLAIELNQWRDELYSRGVIERDAKNPREDFRRVRNSLQARKLIGARDNLVWRAS